MVYHVHNIIEDIKTALDQNISSEPLIVVGDEDALSLDAIIRSKIEEAVERVHRTAPYHMLEQGHNFDPSDDSDDSDDVSMFWMDQCSGFILLPDDFMRLVVFEMSDWERQVYKPITTDSPEYRRQRGRIKALRGTSQRPVCAIVQRPEGKSLEFYSCKSEDATLTKGVYIPYPHIDEDDGIDISEKCYTAVVQVAASLVLMTLEKPDQAKLMLDQANSLLNNQ